MAVYHIVAFNFPANPTEEDTLRSPGVRVGWSCAAAPASAGAAGADHGDLGDPVKW